VRRFSSSSARLSITVRRSPDAVEERRWQWQKDTTPIHPWIVAPDKLERVIACLQVPARCIPQPAGVQGNISRLPISQTLQKIRTATAKSDE
jgi:hypothetical protein